MKAYLAAALLLSALPASAQRIDVAEGDWRNLPLAEVSGHDGISSTAILSIHEAIASGECQVPGQTKRRLDMTVPFALQFASSGTLERIVLPRIGCAKIEAILGRTVLEAVRRGKYAPTGENSAGWYKAQLSFSSS